MKTFALLVVSLSSAFAGGLPSPLISNVLNAPNPVDTRLAGPAGQTEIFYTLAGNANVDIVVYDLFGVRVRQWSFTAGGSGGQAGENSVRWDGTNERGDKVSKGGYLAAIQVRSEAGTAQTIRKIGVIH